MEIHEKIRVLREINQWSQEEMAEKLSMSPNGYAKIERGQSNINIEKLKQIAQIFNIDVVELFATQDKSFFFSIGDNTNNQNYVGSDEKLLLENKNLKELLEAKNNEIAALRQVIDLLKNTENK
ncbi:helix-turn-helix domain-containing protein [Kingella bonacorsii]|uniref:Helix-turn-helix transcriptional regulator n=1 Tax=Kingella bonacorsii TaxID=2796361 RepID=A0ABS1BRI0_9NEIS|nr:helix-turn-helix transcriptional regulator [Kingella bonacorsii]MBK0395891.1 helix-turn-helix transcriptional regulator [Kingella bonacorsii]